MTADRTGDATPHHRHLVTCDLCGVLLHDAMGHVAWHLYLANLGRALGLTGRNGIAPGRHVT